VEEDWDVGLLPDEVAQLLEEQGLQREMFGKQRAWNQIKVRDGFSSDSSSQPHSACRLLFGRTECGKFSPRSAWFYV
jgi:hypothetical protein